MYKYEIHLHTAPVSKCAVATVRETLECYKKMDYDGVFITNHFLGGNINIDQTKPYREKVEFYFSDYENALVIGKEIGIKVFLGIELSCRGTDFLVYGLTKEWFLNHPEFLELEYKERLEFLRANGACIIQAHPFREASYINHIRLFPRSVDAVEVINACGTEGQNKMAQLYAENYDLFAVAGSDNHVADKQKLLAGVETSQPINSVEDFIELIKNRQMKIFTHKKA